ncbi:MAG: LPS export ABC transporter permease LptG [Pseudomonadota bacterium]
MVSRTLSFYLMRSVAQSVLVMTFVLGGLYLTLQLVRELGDLAGNYGVVQMLAYLVRSLPTGLYDLFPFAVLIGVMVAVGRLAAGHELIAMRAGGLNRMGIVGRVLAAVLGLSLLMMAMAEWWMPQLELQARSDREQARSGEIAVSAGREVWLRDGSQMIRAELLVSDPGLGVRFADVQVYAINAERQPITWLQAEQGLHESGGWLLQQVSVLDLVTAKRQQLDSIELESAINPDVFQALSTRPRLLSMMDIRRISGYLRQNGLDTQAYENAFWRRLFYPLNILAMVLVGLPLLFRADRKLAPAASIFAGIAVGIAFFVVWRIVIGLAVLLVLPLWLIHLLPALLFAVFGYRQLRRAS